MKNFRKERAEARIKAQERVSEMTLLEKVSQLKYHASPVERLGIPAYNYWNEALHGVARAGTATVFPQAIGMAAAFDEEAMQKAGNIIATEGRAKYNEYAKHGDRDIYKGLTFWSPNVNIFRDPRWGRGARNIWRGSISDLPFGGTFCRGDSRGRTCYESRRVRKTFCGAQRAGSDPP